MVVSPDGDVAGASVGDSEAWLVGEDGFRALTEGQSRKPVIGSGAASPVPFTAAGARGTLVVATDGLFKYTGEERICEAARGASLAAAAEVLLSLVRLPSGAFPDDVAVALVRLA